MRKTALLVLVVWTTALAACTAHCFLGTSHLGIVADRQNCHAPHQPPSPCHGGPPGNAGGESDSGALCSTLKQMLVSQEVPAAPLPVLATLYFLTIPDIGGFDDPLSHIVLPRRGSPAEFVVTPEVYLGPALHSLAPPVLS